MTVLFSVNAAGKKVFSNTRATTMKIKDIGGEFALIRRLAELVPGQRPEVIKGIGDDAAVLRISPEPAPYLLVTTDILVEDRHFNRAWASPEQIGIKAAECNVSDIAAMGGVPQWMFASLVLPADREIEWIERLYRGIGRSCGKHGIAMLGGDTTQGTAAVINITLLGSVTADHLCLRSDARPGDYLMLTGPLGASAAALAMLNSKYQPSDYLLNKHLAPNCRLDISKQIAPLANAMIDISDGLGSEVHHICSESNVGAEINATSIPLHPDVNKAAQDLHMDPLEWVLGGGEDFELLFSIAPDKVGRLKNSGVSCHQIGRVTDRTDRIVLITAEGSATPLKGGYDHFQ